MTLPTPGEILAIGASIIVFCIIMAFIDTWWEQRKKKKNKRG